MIVFMLMNHLAVRTAKLIVSAVRTQNGIAQIASFD